MSNTMDMLLVFNNVIQIYITIPKYTSNTLASNTHIEK